MHASALPHKEFWTDRKVFVTGHTGFKGSWLCLWLHLLGADVTGYSLAPPTRPSLFELCRIDRLLTSVTGDVRDLEALSRALRQAAPTVVIHLAAQPLVRESYRSPVETYAVNVMGTVNLLEAVRHVGGVQAVINVTTDKCYENREWVWGYREHEPLGGYDPYSSSKACSELVSAAYRRSFFTASPSHRCPDSPPPCLASARAGNVIGGGDWGVDRLIPDCIRSLLQGEKIRLRNPAAIRPWQHVLEPLSGYLILAARLCEEGPAYAEAWNFGPNDDDARPVEWLVRRLCEKWGGGAGYQFDGGVHPHEAQYLKLDCSKARARLGWQPKWGLDKALHSIIDWTRDYQEGKNLLATCIRQIEEYSAAP